ncbi:hypothetical protein LWI29_035067 [Acer saccharum]|uniref:Uncharacterized protein n=1 Tax=Acer saccharum TaxID=4024 RepID=A0AA39SLA8_ACESA|nr:hypothetical protein LWI29_035067 [Acer saccharum]
MTSIFSDMVEGIIEIFMDDFSVMGNSFGDCLRNLSSVLARCKQAHLVLNWEKSHFMVKEGIVLGHIISGRGIEVDKAKVDVMKSLQFPRSVREIRAFLGHAGFYRRFIKDFSKISRPLCRLLQKEIEFDFDEKCMAAFKELKELLTTAPIMRPPDWSLPFELMCDASDYAVGAVLGQRVDKIPHAIYYASRTLTDAQLNYSTTEKELLAVIFALEKFRSYLIGAKEFDLEIRDKKGSENVVADHLSRLMLDSYAEEDTLPLRDSFPDEQLLKLSDTEPWYADIVNFLTNKILPAGMTSQGRKRFVFNARQYFWNDPYLFKHGADQIIRRCIPEDEQLDILKFCHELQCGGHYSSRKTAMKVFHSGFYWTTLFKDAYHFCLRCD